MSTHNNASEHGWADSLRTLALGASIASLFLAPPSVPINGRTTQKNIEIVTTMPDGNLDQRMVFVRTHHGLDTPIQIKSTKINDESKIETDQIPWALHDMSGLTVKALASLAQVSRNAYYKWLGGGGVSDEHKVRLTDLYDTFCTLHDLRGPGLRDFLENSGPAGRPVDLLATGDTDLVIGLALRPASDTTSSSSLSESARRISGLPGWTTPATQLNWDTPQLTASEHEDALDRLSPRPIFTNPKATNDINDEDNDEIFVAWGFFLE